MRRFLPLLLAYGAFALALTWPVVLGLGAVVPGADRTDLWTSMWSLDFFASALVDGRLPLHTTRLGFPGGGSLRVDDPLGALIATPITLLLGVNLAYTLLIWFQLAFSGLMAHGFAQEWLNWRGGHRPGRRVAAAWVAGLGFCSAPILLTAVHNGHSADVGAGWGAWAAWMCWRAAAHGGRRRLELAVASLAVAALSGWSGAATALLFAAALALVGAGEGLRVHLRNRVLVLVLGIAVVVPLGLGIQTLSQGQDALHPPETAEALHTLRRTVGAADPVAYLMPGPYRSPDLQAGSVFGDRKVHVHYLGWTLLGLGVLGWRRDRRGTAPILLAGTAGLLLSLGPVLVRLGEPWLVWGQKVIPLPYLLMEGLPGFDSLGMLYRLAAVPALALALLAASAVSGRKIPWLATAVGLMLAEGQWVAPSAGLPAATRAPRSPAVQMLAGAPEGAVLNFPVVRGRAYLLEQVQHGKPLAGGLVDPSGPASEELWATVLEHSDRDPTWVRTKISSAAKRLGIRYVLIHVDPDAQPDMHDKAIQTLEQAYLPMSQPEASEPGAAAARVLKLW
jgi:hypothetical protein